MDDFERELKLGFLDEAAQAVADVEQCFLSLETDPQNSENLNKIFRLAHNLKGSSKAVGFLEFGRLTHEFETFILKVKNQELPASPSVVNLLLRCNDFISRMIETLKGDLNATFQFEDLLVEMTQVKADTPAEESQLASKTETPETPSESPTFETLVSVAPAPTADEVRICESLPSPAPELTVAVSEMAAPSASAAASPARKAAPEESLRIALSKVESLLNFVGEMVILQSVMREQALKSGSPALIKTVHQLEKVGKEIQDTSMSLRMTPVKPTFQKMIRIVRDTAQALGKNVELHLQGEETELDKTVLERINDPLVHLIRNAVDHGIESPEARKAAGKPEKGSVTLRAYHQSGRLLIEVQDDGGGLNPQTLIQKAQRKGLLKPDQTLSDKDAYQLIFAPGFSTKEQVTDVSGRGVGMDVVKTNIHEIGGEVLIDSKLGQGTTFRVVLPLTLAILDALVVRYGHEKFVFPLSHVYETVSTRDHQVQKSTPLGDVILLRGENLPLFRLGDFFGLKTPQTMQDQITIVVRSGPEPFALTVDDILGQYQIVLKRLGPELQGLKGVSGSTILGDGKPALILEPVDLLKRKRTPVPVATPDTRVEGAKSA
ncbi:MAG: chemotaxis protein CheA [Bdellovibrionales bacterium]